MTDETIFKSAKYPGLHDYLTAKAGAIAEYKPEWQWLRYLVDKKQFAAICTPDIKYKEHHGRTMIILKAEPAEVKLLCEEYEDIVPGFYSDKKHWISVYLDGDISDDLLQKLCDNSFQLIFAKLSKSRQEEILALKV